MKKIVIFNKMNKHYFLAGGGMDPFWTEDAADATAFKSRGQARRWIKTFVNYRCRAPTDFEIKEIG